MKNGALRRVVITGIWIGIAIAGVFIIRLARPGESIIPGSPSPQPTSPAQPSTQIDATEVRPQQPRLEIPAVESGARPAPPTSRREEPTESLKASEKPLSAPIPTAGVAMPVPAPFPDAASSAPPTAPAIVEPPPVMPTAPPEPVPTPEAAREIPAARSFDKEATVLGEMLDRYEQAYDQLDAPAAVAMWSSVDSRALARAFSLLREQDLEFGVCTFAITENEATAHCPGVLRYVRRIGDTTPKTEQHVWTIEFARSGEAWRISRVRAQ